MELAEWLRSPSTLWKQLCNDRFSWIQRWMSNLVQPLPAFWKWIPQIPPGMPLNALWRQGNKTKGSPSSTPPPTGHLAAVIGKAGVIHRRQTLSVLDYGTLSPSTCARRSGKLPPGGTWRCPCRGCRRPRGWPAHPPASGHHGGRECCGPCSAWPWRQPQRGQLPRIHRFYSKTSLSQMNWCFIFERLKGFHTFVYETLTTVHIYCYYIVITCAYLPLRGCVLLHCQICASYSKSQCPPEGSSQKHPMLPALCESKMSSGDPVAFPTSETNQNGSGTPSLLPVCKIVASVQFGRQAWTRAAGFSGCARWQSHRHISIF